MSFFLSVYVSVFCLLKCACRVPLALLKFPFFLVDSIVAPVQTTRGRSTVYRSHTSLTSFLSTCYGETLDPTPFPRLDATRHNS